jgi:protein O-mannosyl-transferase
MNGIASTTVSAVHPSPAPPAARRRVPALALWLSLGVLAGLAYANSFHAGLVLDSKVIVGADPRIRACTADNLRAILSHGYWWPAQDGDLYRPITTLSYLLNFAVFGNGLRVTGYHILNFALHWTNAWLLFLVLRRLVPRGRIAWLAAAIFTLHPVTVEAVTNIVGRADLLATLSILGGAWCYLRAEEAAGGRHIAWHVGLGLVAAAGMFAKETAVMIGPLLVVLDGLWRWPKRPPGPRGSRLVRTAREFGPAYAAIAPAYLLFITARTLLGPELVVVRQPFVDNPIAHAAPFAGFMTAMQVVGRYLGLLLFPRQLSADYSYNQISLYGWEGPFAAQVLAWVTLGLLLAAGWAAWRWRRTNPAATAAVALFLILLLPTSNLIVPIGSIMAERFLYLPLIGAALGAALLMNVMIEIIERQTAANWRPVVPIGLSGLVLAPLAARTLGRNADWRDELSLWGSAVVVSPQSCKAHQGYAGAIWAAGGDERALDAALAESHVALAILDDTPRPLERRDQTLYDALAIYHRVKGEMLEGRGRTADARAQFQQSAEFFERALTVNRWQNEQRRAALERRMGREIFPLGDPKLLTQGARTYLHLGDWIKVAGLAAEIRRLAPTQAGGYSLGGLAELKVRHFEPAAMLFFAAMILESGNHETFQHIAECYAGLGAAPGAIGWGPAGITIDTSHPIVRQHLDGAAALLVGTHLATGRTAEAAQLRESAIRNFRVPPEFLPVVPQAR